MSFLAKNFFLIPILILAAVLMSIRLDKEFIGHHDWNGAWYSNQARNFLRYGYLNTKFGAVTNSGRVPDKNFSYFTHYPPLLPILISLSFKIFGIHEYSARIIPLIFTLATLGLIYFLTLRFFERKTAVLASAIASVLPITTYFGKMPVQEVLVIPFVLLSINFYFDYFQNHKNLGKLLISLILAHLTNWPGYYITPLFFLHYLIFSKKPGKFKTALLFPSLSFLMFILHMAHLALLTGNPLYGMIDVFLYRLNLKDKAIDLTFTSFIKNQARVLVVYFTRPVLLFAFLSSLLLVLKVIKRNLVLRFQFLLILGIFGVIHNLVFRNMAFIHDYMIIYSLPFLAISASYFFLFILDELRINNFPQFVFSIIIFLIIATERIPFTRALIDSTDFREGVFIGKLIASWTSSDEKVLVLSPDFKRYFEVFSNYYADRIISYDILPFEKIRPDYKVVIAIPNRNNPKDLIDVLQQHYKETKIGEYLIFETDKPSQNEEISFGNHSYL